MTSVAVTLAEWAAGLEPGREDLELAHRSLLDTVAVTLAARDHRVTRLAGDLPEGARWAVAGHVLDFDDLHMPSTTHVSVVCVPTALATGGGARAYLAAAGVMARLGTALGWRHYSAGLARHLHGRGAGRGGRGRGRAGPARGADRGGDRAGRTRRGRGAARVRHRRQVAAGRLRGRGGDPGGPARGRGRAGRPDGAGRVASPGGRQAHSWPSAVDPSGPAVPNGLAIKLYPCCYALQRPISALSELAADPAAVRRIVLRTPEATVVPLIHHRPRDGLQGKFSLEYAAARHCSTSTPGFGSFTDAAVRRDEARRLVALVETKLDPGGDWLLDGELEAEVHTADGAVLRVRQQYPPGSPARPPTPDQLAAKLADCVSGLDTNLAAWTWDNAADSR